MGRYCRRVLVIAATVAATFIAREAAARPEARLVYERDESARDCPSEGELRTAVLARLGYDPFVSSSPSELHAQIWRRSGKYHAKVELVDAEQRVSGTRQIEHPGARCADLVEVVALSISIAIDPKRALGLATEPTPEPPVIDEPASAPPVAAPQVAEVTQPEREAVASPPPKTERKTRVQLVGGAAIAAWLGVAPSASTGAMVFAGVRLAPGTLFLEARGDLGSSRNLRPAVVRTSFVAGTVAPCAALGVVFACGVVTVGRLSASSSGIETPREDTGWHALAGGRLGIALPVGSRTEIVLRGELLGALTPQTFVIDGSDVYSLPIWSGGVAVGAQVAFF